MAFILIVDDNPDVREALRDDLEQEGHEIEEAANGREALDACRRNLADLVITDIFMPEKGGLELITELRRECPETTIFAMSSGLIQRKVNPLKIAEFLGATKTFEKPLSLSVLREAIREEFE